MGEAEKHAPSVPHIKELSMLPRQPLFSGVSANVAQYRCREEDTSGADREEANGKPLTRTGKKPQARTESTLWAQTGWTPMVEVTLRQTTSGADGEGTSGADCCQKCGIAAHTSSKHMSI